MMGSLTEIKLFYSRQDRNNKRGIKNHIYNLLTVCLKLIYKQKISKPFAGHSLYRVL